jgi:pyruvate, orthophosphate dikinase
VRHISAGQSWFVGAKDFLVLSDNFTFSIGLGLSEMSRIGVDVPPGFTLTTQVCQLYEATGNLPDELWLQIKEAVARIEMDMKKTFGCYNFPLLLSCRSGAAISMPGMMDTVLDIVSWVHRAW